MTALRGLSESGDTLVPMSISRKPVSLNEDVGTHILGLKITGALSTTESDDHSHSGIKIVNLHQWTHRKI